MLNVAQLRDFVIKPVLQHLDAHSRAAEMLMLGTALVESDLYHLKQLGAGPGLGIYSMEPATELFLLNDYLPNRRPNMLGKVRAHLVPGVPTTEQLIWNLKYATAMARVKYLSIPTALPEANDLEGLALYWKQFYNTAKGKGNPAAFVSRIKTVLPLLT